MNSSLKIAQINRVKVISFNRPEVKNAIDVVTMNSLKEHLLASEHDDTRVVVITGEGGAFCSGADIKSALSANLSPDYAFNILADSYGPALRTIKELKWPVIAAVDGSAAGIGFDLALACDLRLASEAAVFSELFIKVGLIPDGGGTWSLQRLIGQSRAKEMTFTGEPISAKKALEWGIVNRVFQLDTFMEDVLNFSTNLARQSPDALIYGKKAINEAAEGSFGQALKREAYYQKKIFEGKWGFEGFKAFIEKRRPRWMDE
jgi:2-(1,2-epoxy-1,2-dihydrophenyl)acetyl-CoA isomerase